MNGPQYVIVRGPLGVGKTTVAERLANEVEGRTISIDRILEDENLEKWGEVYITEESFLECNAYAARQARPWLADGVPVVFDGNFYWPSALRDLRERLSPALGAVVTLVAPVELCIQRDRDRAVPLGEEGARLVHAKVTSFEAGIPVDARGTVHHVVARVKRAVRWNRPDPARARGSNPTS